MHCSILVITPMKEEQAAFSHTCTKVGYRSNDVRYGRLTATKYPVLNLVLAEGGTGKVQFAVSTQHLLDSDLRPDLVICTGAAGALVDQLSVGDVIIGEATIEHDIREGFIDRPLPIFEAPPSVVDSLWTASHKETTYRILKGAIASGDEDIVSNERRRELFDSTGAAAVGWEGAGGARACRFSGVEYIEVRGITDRADGSAAADFYENLHIAMTNVASLIINWIENRSY